MRKIPCGSTCRRDHKCEPAGLDAHDSDGVDGRRNHRLRINWDHQGQAGPRHASKTLVPKLVDAQYVDSHLQRPVTYLVPDPPSGRRPWTGRENKLKDKELEYTEVPKPRFSITLGIPFVEPAIDSSTRRPFGLLDLVRFIRHRSSLSMLWRISAQFPRKHNHGAQSVPRQG